MNFIFLSKMATIKKLFYRLFQEKFDLRQGIDNRLKQIVTKCASINPYERPTIEEVIKDYYFTEIIHLHLICTMGF